MKRFKRTGPPVDVPVLGLVDVATGQTVEVDDPEISEKFEGQADVWEHIPDPQRSKAAKKAAATRDDDVKES